MRKTISQTQLTDLVLPEHELRNLVRGVKMDREAFIRRMMPVLDNAKNGKGTAVRIKDRCFKQLIDLINAATRRGNRLTAGDSAFLAIVFAYGDTCRHLKEVVAYIRELRSE